MEMQMYYTELTLACLQVSGFWLASNLQQVVCKSLAQTSLSRAASSFTSPPPHTSQPISCKGFFLPIMFSFFLAFNISQPSRDLSPETNKILIFAGRQSTSISLYYISLSLGFGNPNDKTKIFQLVNYLLVNPVFAFFTFTYINTLKPNKKTKL